MNQQSERRKKDKKRTRVGRGHRATARLIAYYVSRDRVFALIRTQTLPAMVVAALRCDDAAVASAVLSNAVGSYVLSAVASGEVQTLQQLALQNRLRPQSPFVYNGHFYGKGFGHSNRSLALSLSEKLEAPLAGKRLVFEFSKNGLVNATAYTRMAGSTRLFAFGYITDVDAETIRAAPYVIGDLVDHRSTLNAPFAPTLEIQPQDIKQFSGIDQSWLPTQAEFRRLADFPERTVKTLICGLLKEHQVPADWGGEESDLFSANLVVRGTRKTAAFLLKGPAKFHPMKLTDLGANGDQLYRLFNVPAQVYVVQHCHNIGPAVRKTIEAFALSRALIAPCQYVIIDGVATARLLRAHGLWDTNEKRGMAKRGRRT